MKKIIGLATALIIAFSATAYADESVVMTGENGSFDFVTTISSELRAKSTLDYKYYGDHVEIKSDSTSGDFVTTVELPNGAYLERFSDEEYEKEVILIKNDQNEIMGLVDIPVRITSDGTHVYGTNELNSNKIVHHFDEDLEYSNVAVSVYATRPYTYYFSGIGYNNGGAKHDYWMQPIASVFVSEIEGLGTYVSSWNSLNAGMRGYLTGSDLTNWNGNQTSLMWQYRCHYEFVSPLEIWNIEHTRHPSSYQEVVNKRCNP